MKPAPYSALRYSIRILNNGDGTYSVEVPKLPGCYSSGRTKDECIRHVIEAIELHLEDVAHAPPEDPMPAIEVVQAPPKAGDTLVPLLAACKILDVSEATLRRYIKSGKVPAYRLGRDYKFRLGELAALIEATRVPPRLTRARKSA